MHRPRYGRWLLLITAHDIGAIMLVCHGGRVTSVFEVLDLLLRLLNLLLQLIHLFAVFIRLGRSLRLDGVRRPSLR